MTAGESRPEPSPTLVARKGDSTGVEVTFLSAGRCRVPEVAVRPWTGLARIDLPALVAVIHHPTEGPVLFDTGYSPRFFEATRHYPRRLYRLVTPVQCEPADTVAAQVQRLGIALGDVRWVVISHFDPDHIGGMRDFPEARFVCHAEAWATARDVAGAMSARVMPGHLPLDLEERLQLVADFPSASAGPLSGAHDLFGDGTVLLVNLPGHAPGQLGALVGRPAAAGGGSWLLAADAVWTRATLTRAGPTAHALFAVDRTAQAATYTLLRQLRRERPDITIVPSHCPEAADELLPDPRCWRSEP